MVNKYFSYYFLKHLEVTYKRGRIKKEIMKVNEVDVLPIQE
jgi:hypothetical protein